jgi:hypothetical protein
MFWLHTPDKSSSLRRALQVLSTYLVTCAGYSQALTAASSVVKTWPSPPHLASALLYLHWQPVTATVIKRSVQLEKCFPSKQYMMQGKSDEDCLLHMELCGVQTVAHSTHG